MRLLRNLLIASAFICTSTVAFASGGGGCGVYTAKDEKGHEHEHTYACSKAYVNFNDKPSLQRGAATFLSYCVGCHSAKYQRYERMAEDLDIPKPLVEEYMMHTSDKIGGFIDAKVDPKVQKNWFGATPPDLTMETRLRSPDWVYSYLLSFYPDESKAWGVNNKVFKDVAMPHVLDNLYQEVGEKEYKKRVADLVNFMAYTAEPIAHKRKVIGIFVLLLLAILFIPVYLLNKEFWKDVK